MLGSTFSKKNSLAEGEDMQRRYTDTHRQTTLNVYVNIASAYQEHFSQAWDRAAKCSWQVLIDTAH